VGDAAGPAVRVAAAGLSQLRRQHLPAGRQVRIIAFITETAPVEQILLALGAPRRPPPISPAHGPPAWDEAPESGPDCDPVAQPEPEFDQRIAG